MANVPAYELDPDYHTQGEFVIPGVAGVFQPGEPVLARNLGISEDEMDALIKGTEDDDGNPVGGVPLVKVSVADPDAPKKETKEDLLDRAAELGLDLPKSTTVPDLREAILAAEQDAATASVPGPLAEESVPGDPSLAAAAEAASGADAADAGAGS